MAEPEFIDEKLDFADLHFPQGRAFAWSNLDEHGDPSVPVQVHVPAMEASAGQVIVAKRWQQIGQQTALVESVQWTNIEPYLAGLPLMAQTSEGSKSVQYANLDRQMPKSPVDAKSVSKP